jgi:hypothetical protein
MADNDAVSLRQFAAMQGWNPSHAHRLKSAGRLVMVSEGGRDLVHVSQSLARIAESTSPQKGYMAAVNQRQRELHRGAEPAPPVPAVRAVPAAPPPGADPILPSDSEAPGQQSRNATYNQARTAREVYEAKLAQLKYEQEVGRLVNADEVRAEFAKQVVVVRDQFLRLPDRLAPMLVGLADIETIKRAIMVEVRTALTQFTGAA